MHGRNHLGAEWKDAEVTLRSAKAEQGLPVGQLMQGDIDAAAQVRGAPLTPPTFVENDDVAVVADLETSHLGL